MLGVESILKLPHQCHYDIFSKTHPSSSRNVMYGKMLYLQFWTFWIAFCFLNHLCLSLITRTLFNVRSQICSFSKHKES